MKKVKQNETKNQKDRKDYPKGSHCLGFRVDNKTCHSDFNQGSKTMTRGYIHLSPGFPACWLQIWGLLSLHNHVNLFLIINPYLSLLIICLLWRIQSDVSISLSTLFFITHFGSIICSKSTCWGGRHTHAYYQHGENHFQFLMMMCGLLSRALLSYF